MDGVEKIKYGPGNPRPGSPSTVEDLFTNIDWDLFHQQKISLVTILGLSVHSLGHDFDISEAAADQMLEHLSGILDLLDAFQDTASDILGIDAANPPLLDEGEMP